MLCCLCLKGTENAMPIFGDSEMSEKYNVAAILAKHFWFEPNKDDPAFTAICNACWGKLYDFHKFYEMVEIVHHRLINTEIVTVKSEETLACKDEPYEENLHELGEVPLSTELVALNQSTKSCSTLDSDIHFNAHNSNDSHSYDNEFDMDYQEEDSEHSDPFDDTEVVRDMHEQDLQTPTEKRTRSTRNSKKSNAPADSVLPSVAEKLAVPVKRGRKPKVKISLDHENKGDKPKKSKCKEKPNKNPDEESAYKNKMKSFDNEISQYMGLHCDVCNIAVENFATLKNHMRIEHSIENGYVKCCDKKFCKRANLLYHIRRHVNPNCYRCEDCDQIFSDYQSLRNHLNVKHQKEEDKIYKCNECPKKFARKYLLEQHRTFKHKDRCKQCKMCNRRYKTIEELEEHNKEPCAAGIMCDICAKVIFGPGAFKRHQLEHDGGDAHKLQCDLCGSWHKDKYALRKHKRRHLEPKTPHVCDICNKVSPSREAMVSHKKYAHRSDRTFECEFCKKCFKRPISLREHLTTHTGAVLYTCPYCPKTFNSNANMHSHRKNVHPVEFEEARKRRQRVGYMGDQNSSIDVSKPLAIGAPITDSKIVPNLPKVESNHTITLFDAN
ncbi:transcription factor grauzone [Stomoxys calcitrans]|uniref:Transcription factor grauzone n=1 Tax=Stomoxys calcitrans TaxID=35570 RepID=A0A1I8NUZ0_STOCA|nr:transcription factor grauzone [Stomoxys calcitrans]